MRAQIANKFPLFDRATSTVLISIIHISAATAVFKLPWLILFLRAEKRINSYDGSLILAHSEHLCHFQGHTR